MTNGAQNHGQMIVQLSATNAAENRYVPSPRDGTDVLGGARVGRSPRFGTQSYFWTEDWQQAERLADFDYSADMDFEPKDMDELLAWLDSDD